MIGPLHSVHSREPMTHDSSLSVTEDFRTQRSPSPSTTLPGDSPPRPRSQAGSGRTGTHAKGPVRPAPDTPAKAGDRAHRPARRAGRLRSSSGQARAAPSGAGTIVEVGGMRSHAGTTCRPHAAMKVTGRALAPV